MKNSTQRRGFIGSILMIAALFSMRGATKNTSHASFGGGTLRGHIPSYSAKRSKHKGFMRDSDWKKKHKR